MRYSRGFTLLELLISLSIMSIVMMMAVPSFMDFRLKSQVRAGMAVSDLLKTRVERHYADFEAVPQGSDINVSGTGSTPLLSNVSVSSGAILLTYGNDAAGPLQGLTVHLMPHHNGDGLLFWSCGYHDLSSYGWTPAGDLTYATTIPPELLPVECRVL